MLIEKLRDKNNYPIILFIVVLINYIPLILLNMCTKESVGVNTIYIGICFLIELIILITFFYKKIEINFDIKKQIAILTIISIVLFLIQIKNFIIKDYRIMDFINVGCQFINILLFFIFTKNIKINEEKIDCFMKAIILMGLVACINNMILYYSEILNFFGILELKEKAKHMKSFFANRNQFAFFLYLAIVANMYVLNKNKNIFYKITFPILFLNIFFSMSRTGILIASMFLLIYIFMSDKISKKSKIILLTTICICGIIFLVVLNCINPKLIENLVRIQSLPNLSGRTDIWERGINIIFENPINFLFGVGRFKGIEVLKFKTKTFTQFHNIYIDCLVTGGIIELIFIGYIYWYVIKNVINSNMDKSYKRLYISMFITYFIYIAFESFGRFSIGASDTLCLAFFVAIPLLHSNIIIKKEKTEEK